MPSLIVALFFKFLPVVVVGALAYVAYHAADDGR